MTTLRPATPYIVLSVGMVLSILGTALVHKLEYTSLRQQVEAASENRTSAFQREVFSETARLGLLVSFLEAGAERPGGLERLMGDLRASVGSNTTYCWMLAGNRTASVCAGMPAGWRTDRILNHPQVEQAIQGAAKVGRAVASQRFQLGGTEYSVAVAQQAHTAQGDVGTAIAIYRITDVLERGMQQLRPFGINVAIYDLSAARNNSLLSFHRSRRSHSTRVPSFASPPPSERTGHLKHFEVGGRTWMILCTGIPELSTWNAIGYQVLVLATGFVISLLAATVFRKGEQRRQEVEQIVRQRTQELAEARDVAVEASRLKSQFLANVSHEVRTPLNGILGTNALLLESHLTADQREQSETVQSCARALLTLVEDLLDLARIEAGMLVLRRSDYSLRQIVSECAAVASVGCHRKGLRWSWTVAAGTPNDLNGDPHRVRQILLNLLSNAIKFTEAGAVHLTVEGQCGNPGSILLRVRDSGPGVPEESRHILFKRFAQANGDATRRHGGVGLGLAISKQLVEMMGGDIGFESEAGKGSEFWFRIPVVPACTPVTAGAATASQEIPSQLGLRILVAEDNAINQKVARRLLERLGCDVELVEDGQAAVERALQATFDVILMDLQMPLLDGMAATRAIRKGEADRRTPIIALTANAMNGDRERCIEAGMDDHIAKPVDLADLRRVLDRYAQPPQSLSRTPEFLSPSHPCYD